MSIASEQHHAERPAHDRARVARLIIAFVVVAVLVAIAIDNKEEVDVGYVIGDVRAPVWIVLVAAGIAGIVVGWLIKHRPRHHD